jgi:MFS family permease
MRLRPLPRSLSVLDQRRFRRLFVSQSVSSLGDKVVPVGLAFAVLDAGGSVSDLGLTLAAASVPMLLFLLPGGVWADRLPRILVAVVADLVRAIAQGATALVLLTGGASHLVLVVVLQAVYGTARAFFQPALTGLVPELVPAQELQAANALVSMTRYAAAVAGPGLAGVVVATAGGGWTLALDAVSFVVSALLLRGLHVPAAVRAGARRTTALVDLRQGWDAFRTRGWLWGSVVYFAIFQGTVLAAVQVLGPAVALDDLGGRGAWAAISIGLGAGSVAGSVVALRWRPRHPLRTIVPLFAAAWTAVLAALLSGLPVSVITLLAAGGGAATSVFGAAWSTTLQTHVEPEMLSRVSAYDWLGSQLLQPVGFALIGPLAAQFGIRAVLIAAAAVFLTSSALLWGARTVRDLAAFSVPGGVLDTGGGTAR